MHKGVLSCEAEGKVKACEKQGWLGVGGGGRGGLCVASFVQQANLPVPHKQRMKTDNSKRNENKYSSAFNSALSKVRSWGHICGEREVADEESDVHATTSQAQQTRRGASSQARPLYKSYWQMHWSSRSLQCFSSLRTIWFRYLWLYQRVLPSVNICCFVCKDVIKQKQPFINVFIWYNFLLVT